MADRCRFCYTTLSATRDGQEICAASQTTVHVDCHQDECFSPLCADTLCTPDRCMENADCQWCGAYWCLVHPTQDHQDCY